MQIHQRMQVATENKHMKLPYIEHMKLSYSESNYKELSAQFCILGQQFFRISGQSVSEHLPLKNLLLKKPRIESGVF